MWDLPGPGIEPMSPVLAGSSLPLSHHGSPSICLVNVFFECLLYGRQDMRGTRDVAVNKTENGAELDG